MNSWSDFLTKEADILLYGCNVAKDLVGIEFVNNLSEYTQADIAASNDLTSNIKIDGDWDLEYIKGEIETDKIFNSKVETEYQSALIVLDNIKNYDSTWGFLDNNFPVFDFNSSQFEFPSLVDLNPNYTFDNTRLNSVIFNFSANSLTFDPINFDFTSLEINGDSLSFNINNSAFDLSSVDKNSIAFEFYKTQTEKFNYGSVFSFDASSVTFTNSKVTFKYNPNSLNYNPDLFKANANLFEYKLSYSNFQQGVNFEQFNASDYRALGYAFKGDELFNTKYYLDKKVAPIGMNPFTHYVEYGFLAGIDPNPLFDVSYYLDQNIDVRNAKIDPLKHYAQFGYAENNNNRDPHPLFDTSYYNDKNFDVALAKENPLLHYIIHGYSENFNSRDPNPFFDSSYYNLKNPDVALAKENPLLHYLVHGWKESIPGSRNFNDNRDPNAFFDTSYYFEIHNDVRIASDTLPSANPVQHYLEFGNTGRVAIENRTTHPLLNSENILEFEIEVNANSEGFEYVQNELAKYNYQLTPLENRGILIASREIPNIGGIAVEAFKYSIFVGATIVKLGIDLGWEVLTDNTFSSYSFSPADFDVLPFPGETEAPIEVESFPTGSTLKDLLGTENIFWTPLEPVDANSRTSFPQRDEILEGLLDGPFIFPDAGEIPIGVYTIGEIFSATNRNIVIDKGFARELKVADTVGGYKVVTPGRPKKDLTVYNKNNPSDGLSVDVVGPNNELILVGGANKANDLKRITSDSITLKRIADSLGVQAQAYYADNTPQAAIDEAAKILGANNVFVFPDVDTTTPEEISNLRDLDIITDKINF